MFKLKLKWANYSAIVTRPGMWQHSYAGRRWPPAGLGPGLASLADGITLPVGERLVRGFAMARYTTARYTMVSGKTVQVIS